MKVVRNDIGQAAVLGLIPDVLHGIKVRRIGWKPFHLKPGSGVRQELSRRGTMSGQAIPHQNDGTTQMSMDFAHKLDEIRRSCIVIQQFVVQPQPQRPGGSGDGGDRRDSIPSIPRTLQGSVALRRPHTPPQRLQQKATFVEKNQASLTLEALFLVAAKIRDASGQCPPRFARGRGAPASADSSPTDAANVARTPDETPRRTIAGSCRALKARSIHPVHSPSIVCRALRPQPVRAVRDRTAWALCPDEAWTAACRRASTPAASDAPMKRSNQRPQPLPSTAFPSRRAWLRLFDGLRASRGFLMVSCPNCTEAAKFSIN